MLVNTKYILPKIIFYKLLRFNIFIFNYATDIIKDKSAA